SIFAVCAVWLMLSCMPPGIATGAPTFAFTSVPPGFSTGSVPAASGGCCASIGRDASAMATAAAIRESLLFTGASHSETVDRGERPPGGVGGSVRRGNERHCHVHREPQRVARAPAHPDSGARQQKMMLLLGQGIDEPQARALEEADQAQIVQPLRVA